MMCRLNKFSRIYAAMVLAGAGIFELIDLATMIALVIVLCVLPNRDCIPAARKA